MRARSHRYAATLVLILGIATASTAWAADSLDLATVGLDVFPVAGQNQPSSIGDFTGKVGYALFAVDNVHGFTHFEADMRFMQGIARNQLTAGNVSGQWGLT